MPAYNQESYIGEAIKSILDQTFTDFEFIIINDGSTDKTEEEILKFKDERIVYVKNYTNLKLIESLNIGLRMARGKYIARMDSDDICMNSRLMKQVTFLENNPDVGICGSHLEVFGTESGIMRFPLTSEGLRLHLLITSCFGNNVVMMRKEIIEKHNLYFNKEYLHAEDYDCWTRWLSVTKGATIDDCLIKYRAHTGSVSQKYRELQRTTMVRIRKEYLTRCFPTVASENAESFYGSTGFSRILSARFFIRENKAREIFDNENFIKKVTQLWYTDSLEEIRNGRIFTFFVFPLILTISLKDNLKRFVNLFKHYYITRLKGQLI
ncbi:MAG: glycosyltransferase family 2 protein [Bacteroidia bacterium]